jgi:hypothetical protein
MDDDQPARSRTGDAPAAAGNAEPGPLAYQARGAGRNEPRTSGSAKLFFVLGAFVLAIAAVPLFISMTTEYTSNRAPFARLAAAIAIPGALAFVAGFVSLRRGEVER